jgi:hypothetical protein
MSSDEREETTGYAGGNVFSWPDGPRRGAPAKTDELAQPATASEEKYSGSTALGTRLPCEQRETPGVTYFW